MICEGLALLSLRSQEVGLTRRGNTQARTGPSMQNGTRLVGRAPGPAQVHSAAKPTRLMPYTQKEHYDAPTSMNTVQEMSPNPETRHDRHRKKWTDQGTEIVEMVAPIYSHRARNTLTNHLILQQVRV